MAIAATFDPDLAYRRDAMIGAEARVKTFNVLLAGVDPRGFTAEWAAMLAEHRVSRVSLGVQTFNPAVQTAIGRVQPVAEIRRVMALLRRADVKSINSDLMYGLPNQSKNELETTLADGIGSSTTRT